MESLGSPIHVHYCGSLLAGVQSSLQVLGRTLSPGFVPKRVNGGAGWASEVLIHGLRHPLRITRDNARQKSFVEDSTRIPAAYSGLRQEFEALGAADGIVFVVDSQVECRERNVWYANETLRHLRQLGRTRIPCVLQLNKRDLPNATSVSEIVAGWPLQTLASVESVASEGTGVLPCLERLLLEIVSGTANT